MLKEVYNFSELVMGVSTVKDGNMSQKWGDPETVRKNRENFLNKLGIKYEECVTMSLVHGTDIVKVGKPDRGRMVEADGLVTNEPGTGLFMMTADCLPVIMFDATKKILSLVHLGWKGVNGKLASKAIRRFGDLGCKPADIKVWIGPGARRGTYKKWDRGWDEFVRITGKNMKEWEEFIEETDDGKKTLDLAGYVLKQLRDSGVRDVEVSPVDTFTDTNYFSHHRAYFTKESEGRFATVACLPAGRR